MVSDKSGFQYPEVDATKCIECDLCEKVCPFLHPDEGLKPKECFAAININTEERKLSSSGGIFIALARNTIQHGGIVFGAVFNEDWSVSHRSAETLDEVLPMMTSKYLQSRMENCYQEAKMHLQAGREVLFTGTPCQIAGLKHFLRRGYPNLIAVEVICHGVPSPGVWKDYISSLLDLKDIKDINFRDKRHGWKNYGMNITTKDNKNIFVPSTENPYMGCFLREYTIRPSCFACEAKAGKSECDITLGDFWGIEKSHHEYGGDYNDDYGCSCVIARTPKAISLLEKLDINYREVNYFDILNGNKSLEESAIEPQDRPTFWEKYINKRNKQRVLKDFGLTEYVPFSIRIKRVLLPLARFLKMR